jgi:hypothetical protein
MMIVKVQTPLGSSDPKGGKALVYNEGRSFERFIPITSKLVSRMAGDPKRFFYATLNGEHLELGEQAPWQDW